MKELWKDIDGYAGMYAVSSLGRVKALARTVVMKNGVVRNHKERFLVQDPYYSNTTMYFRVTLCKENVSQRFTVHQLVAKAFIPNPECKPHVNHINNDGSKNYVTNLEWCTHSENMIHAQKQGRLTASQVKGGQTIKAIKEAASVEKYTKLIGNVYGSWRVLRYLTQSSGRYYMECLCTGCNKTVRKQEVNRLLQLKVSCCQSCRSKQKI